MGKLIYSMGVSLDGYIAGPDGGFDWAAPDQELHRFHNQQAGELGAQLYGRRLYETMRFWQTREDDPAASEVEREFARIWKATPKVVFSTTLDEVEGSNTRLAQGKASEEVARLKAEPGKDLAVGGAGLAATFIALDLVDEYRPFVNPVVVGGGTPFFPTLEAPLDLELVETRTFASRVVYLRYARVRG
jgi:dihydrofolate reductase